MKAIIFGSSSEPLTLEAACYLLDWKQNHPQHFMVGIELYNANKAHFETEYSSIFKSKLGVFIAF